MVVPAAMVAAPVVVVVVVDVELGVGAEAVVVGHQSLIPGPRPWFPRKCGAVAATLFVRAPAAAAERRAGGAPLPSLLSANGRVTWSRSHTPLGRV